MVPLTAIIFGLSGIALCAASIFIFSKTKQEQ
jgi:hypothetical protein